MEAMNAKNGQTPVMGLCYLDVSLLINPMPIRKSLPAPIISNTVPETAEILGFL